MGAWGVRGDAAANGCPRGVLGTKKGPWMGMEWPYSALRQCANSAHGDVTLYAVRIEQVLSKHLSRNACIVGLGTGSEWTRKANGTNDAYLVEPISPTCSCYHFRYVFSVYFTMCR